MNCGIELIIDNDPDLLRTALDIVRSVNEDAPQCEQVVEGTWTVDEAVKFNLQDHLKGWIEEHVESMEQDKSVSDIVKALAHSAFASISWPELARHYRDKFNEGATA